MSLLIQPTYITLLLLLGNMVYYTLNIIFENIDIYITIKIAFNSGFVTKSFYKYTLFTRLVGELYKDLKQKLFKAFIGE